MATAMGMYVDIPGLHGHIYSLRVAYQDMPYLPVNDRYLFIENGDVHHVWNGRRKAWGNRTEGTEPVWRTFHTIVPTMARLISGAALNNVAPFCIHAWDESVPNY
jgi:hypothetical protein